MEVVSRRSDCITRKEMEMCSLWGATSEGVSAPNLMLETGPGRAQSPDHSSNASLAEDKS